MREMKEPQIGDLRAEEIRGKMHGLMALNRQRVHIRLSAVTLNEAPVASPLIEKKITVGYGQPEAVLGQLQKHRVVEHPA